MRKILMGAAAGLFVASVAVLPVSAHNNNSNNSIQKVTVMPDDLDDPTAPGADSSAWYFYDDVANTATASEDASHYHFVTGPTVPPAGVGSVEFHNDVEAPASSNQRWNMATLKYAGSKLSDVKALKFNTYQPSYNPGSTNKALYLNFDVDFDGVGGTNTYQGRLAYVPSVNGTVQQNAWQEWDAIDSGNAKWTSSRYNGTWPNHPELTDQYLTWNQIKTAYPDAIMSAGGTTPGQLLLRSGEPYADGFTGYLDKVTVGVKNKTTVFNFDPSLKPTDTDQCSDGDWRRFNDPAFNSEGDCVNFVKHPSGNNHHGKHHNGHWKFSFKDNWNGPNRR